MSSSPIPRRVFLSQLSLLAVGGAACFHPRAAPNRRTLVNDVHSQLNPTYVRRIARPNSSRELQQTVLRGSKEQLPLAVAGGRHAMGGQQFASEAILVDTRGLDRVLGFDPAAGRIHAESGIQWPALLRSLLRRQGGAEGVWTFAQKQTGANHLTLGGALAANVHGRGLRMRPFVSDVEAFTLVNAEGELVRCSRTERPELFRLAIGGYGLFGLIYSVTLRLVPRQRLQRRVEVIDVSDLVSGFQQRIDDGYLYGDFQYAIDPASSDYLRKGIFSCYRPAGQAAPAPPRRRLRRRDWEDLVYLAHAAPARAFDEYARYYLATSGQTYWSDLHQFSNYLDGYHAILDRRLGLPAPATEVITEMYVPRAELVEFMGDVAEDFRRHQVKVIYGTIRLIERDGESFLAWAREPFACVIFNLCTVHTPQGIAASRAAFQRLNDLAIRRGGSFYLTYHRFATRQQLHACYPQFGEFLALKRKYDPAERFQSDWYADLRRVWEG